jgi:tetratricopeptide (TPR) repeat protein
MNRKPSAKDTAKTSEGAANGDIEAFVSKGIRALKEKDYTVAVKCFRVALRHYPFRKDIRDMLAFALDQCPVEELETGGEELAIEEPKIVRERGKMRLRTGIWLFIFGFVSISAVAFLFFYNENIRRFIAEMTQGRIGLDPVEREVNTLFARADIYLDQRNYDEAIATLEKALSMKPSNPKPLEDRLAQVNAARGEYYYAQNNYQKAAESYENAAELNSNVVDYHYNLGWSYYMLGRNAQRKGRPYTNHYRKAIASFEKAIEVDSSHVRSYSALGRVYINMNNQPEAIRMYRRIIEIAPDSKEAEMARKDLESMTGKKY